MLKPLLSTGEMEAPLANAVYDPARSTTTLAKVATPAEGSTLAWYTTMPPTSFTCSCTGAAEFVAGLPSASDTVSWMAGAMATPAVALEGCVMKASADGASACTVNGFEVALASP